MRDPRPELGLTQDPTQTQHEENFIPDTPSPPARSRGRGATGRIRPLLGLGCDQASPDAHVLCVASPGWLS